MSQNVIGCEGRLRFNTFMCIPLYSLQQFLIWPSSTYFHHVSLLGDKVEERLETVIF